MKRKFNVLFLEYTYFDRGEHCITVIVKHDRQRIIVGRIFKEFNNQTKKYEYYSTDALGNRVFVDYKELNKIKKQFRKHSETMAMALQAMPKQTKQAGAMPFHHKAKRAKEVKDIREKKTNKEKTKEVLKSKISEKRTLNQMERVQDSKNTEKYKDAELKMGKDDTTEKMKSKSSLSEEERGQLAEEGQLYEAEQRTEAVEIEKSAREIELDQIREDKEDREQEQEIDI